MRAALRATLDRIDPWDEVEREHQRDALAWLDSGAPLYRVAKPADPPKHLVAYALLVDVAARAVLLLDHRLSGLWLPAGGHVDPGEPPATAARRELGEELGVDGVVVAPWGAAPFFVTVTRTIGQEQHLDVSLWHTFSGLISQRLDVDRREASATRWWDFDEVRHGPGTRFDPHLPRAIAKLAAGQGS